MTHNFQAIWSVRNAILGPTPGREQSSSTVFGRSESNSSRSLRAAFFRYLSEKIHISASEKGEKRESGEWGNQWLPPFLLCCQCKLQCKRTQSCVSKSRLSRWLLLFYRPLHQSYLELINSLQAPLGDLTRPHQRLDLLFVKIAWERQVSHIGASRMINKEGGIQNHDVDVNRLRKSL